METKDKAKFHIVLVQGVIFKEGKALIAQRSYEELQAPGMWSLPGGKVELYGDDEDVIEKTLNQEFQEEVGITLQKEIHYLKSGSFIRKDNSSVVTLCFVGMWKEGIAKPLEDSIDIAWISEEEIKNYEYPNGVEKLIREGFKSFNSLYK